MSASDVERPANARPGLRGWLVLAAALFGCAITFALGLWQWDRARQKLELAAGVQARDHLPAIPLREALATADPAQLMHRRVLVREGEWAGPTLFLDNRQMEGKVGFYVATALRLGDKAVLVQRGWAPRNFQNREQLPPVSTGAGQLAFEGRIAPPPAQLYSFSAAERGPIRQNLDLPRLREETRLPLETRFSVQQVGSPSEGLLRQWPQPASGADKNKGYAFQWWGLSALIVILYAWFRFIRPRRAATPG